MNGSKIQQGAPLIGLGLLSLTIGGCGPSVEGVVEQYRDEVQNRLAQVATVSAMVEDAAWDRGMGFEGVQLDFIQSSGGELSPFWNACVVHAEHVKDLSEHQEFSGLEVFGTFMLVESRGYLDSVPSSIMINPSRVESTLAQTAQLRYLVVIRQIEYKQPQSLEGTAFVGGSYSADAICFDLERCVQLGGIRFEASNSDSGEYSYSVKYNDPSQSKSRAISHDLRNNAREAFWEALWAVSPGLLR